MIIIRNIKICDLKNIRELIKKCFPLDFHTLYTYWVLAYHFQEFCFVAEKKNELIGYISGLVSNRKDNTAFIWQIGVTPEYRGTGLSQKLLYHFFDSVQKNHIKYVQVSIDPKNIASLKCFRKFVQATNRTMRKIDELHLKDVFEEFETYEDIYEIVV